MECSQTPSEYELIKNSGFNLNYECEEYPLKDLVPSEIHTILFDHNSLKHEDHVGPPDPLPVQDTAKVFSIFKNSKSPIGDQWNDNFVKMPFSTFNLNTNNQSQWAEIHKCLSKLSDTIVQDPDSIHIEYAIKIQNSNTNNGSSRWRFDALHHLFNEEWQGPKGEKILTETIPKMVKLALDLPNKIRCPIPILKRNSPHSITMSQEQCACILANCFFSTWPERDYHENSKELPFINFNRWMGQEVQKLKCILHYFQRVTSKMPDGVITTTRNCMSVDEMSDFKMSNKTFGKVLLFENGTIEDCIGAIQMDFANKYLGGGVLNHGCVQEEIRFIICPELLVSMLFCEVMDENEAIVIKGCERFSSYKGYADTFEWSGDYVDEVARDEWKRRYTHVLALDALSFRQPELQYKEKNVNRELLKCFCGFRTRTSGDRRAAIATGNWGCGAFRGNIELKFLIQMMAAAESGRDLIYYYFGDKRAHSLERIFKIITVNSLTVSQVYNLISEYNGEIAHLSRKQLSEFRLAQFLAIKYNADF